MARIWPDQQWKLKKKSSWKTIKIAVHIACVCHHPRIVLFYLIAGHKSLNDFGFPIGAGVQAIVLVFGTKNFREWRKDGPMVFSLLNFWMWVFNSINWNLCFFIWKISDFEYLLRFDILKSCLVIPRFWRVYKYSLYF